MVGFRGSTTRCAGLLLTVLLAPCSRAAVTTTDAPSPAATLAPGAEPTQLASAAGEVETAYRAAWAATIDAGRHPEAEAEQLAVWMSGTQLSTIRRRLHALAVAHRTLRGTVQLRPTVTVVADGTATVRDCQDSSGWLAYDDRGRPLGRGVPRRDLLIATLTFRQTRTVRRRSQDGRTRWVDLGPGWQVTGTRIEPGGC